MALSQLHVDGTYLRNTQNDIVILRGFNYNYFEWYSGSNEQFAYMKQWGGNIVTLGIKCEPLEEGIASYGGALNYPNLLNQIDAFVQWARNNNLYVILRWVNDGTVNGHMRNEMSYYMDYFGYNNWLNMWQTLAARYSGKGLLYCLTGEPLWWTASTAQSQMQAARNAITTEDSSAIVICPEFMEGDWKSTLMTIYNTYPITGNNVIYSFDDYAYHFLSNTKSTIRSYLTNIHGAAQLLASGKCVYAQEFGDEGNGLDYYKHAWESSGTAAFSTPWLINFAEVMEEDGYSGYVAWAWNVGTGSDLLADWNGTPNGYGQVIQNYYQSYEPPEPEKGGILVQII